MFLIPINQKRFKVHPEAAWCCILFKLCYWVDFRATQRCNHYLQYPQMVNLNFLLLTKSFVWYGQKDSKTNQNTWSFHSKTHWSHNTWSNISPENHQEWCRFVHKTPWKQPCNKFTNNGLSCNVCSIAIVGSLHSFSSRTLQRVCSSNCRQVYSIGNTTEYSATKSEC